MQKQIDQLFEDVHLAIKQHKYAQAMVLLRIIGEQWTIWLCQEQQINAKHLHQRQRLHLLQLKVNPKILKFLHHLQSTGNRAVHQLEANPKRVIYYLTHLERYVSGYSKHYAYS